MKGSSVNDKHRGASNRNRTMPLTTLRRANRIIASIIALGTVVVVGLLGWQSIRLWKELTSPAPVNTPYNDFYQAKDFPGRTAMVNMTATPPEGINAESWKTGAVGKNDLSINVLPKSCTQLAPATSRITYKTAQGDGVNLMVMVYGAGQARAQFDRYVDQLKQCGTNVDDKDNIITADGVVLMTRGDMILSLTGDDTDKLTALRDWYAVKMNDELMATKCAVLDEKAVDAARSFYYDQNAYTGLKGSTTVKVDDTVLQPSVPEILEAHDMDVSKAFPDPRQGKDTTVPESPLPQGMESKLPTAPALPSIQPVPVNPSVSKTVSYQVTDTVGPGCGWEWAGQKAPGYDTDIIEANRKAILKDATTELKNGIKSYNHNVISWSRSTALAMAFQTKWNVYTDKTNGILDSWAKLSSARDALRGPWYQYVDDANAWLHWDDNVASARKQYDGDMKSCVDTAKQDYQKKLADWKKRKQEFEQSQSNPSPSPSPSPSDTGEQDDADNNRDEGNSNGGDREFTEEPPVQPTESGIQQNCVASVQRPDILSQSKPEKPVAPVIPEGVTIPDSWPDDPLA